MRNDKRYKTVKRAFEQGEIKTFYEIFERIPKNIVVRDLEMSITIFSKLKHGQLDFTLGQIFEIAFLFEIDEFCMVDLIWQQYKVNESNTISKKEIGCHPSR